MAKQSDVKCAPCTQVTEPNCGCKTVVQTVPQSATSCITCNTCNCNPCSCSSSCSPSIAVPYVQQQHCCVDETLKDNFAKIDGEFTVPACGSSAPVTISNVVLTVGQIISKPGVGQFHVSSKDGCTYYLENKCESCIANPPVVGTVIPSSTEFTLGPLPECIGIAGTPSSTDVLLCTDFIVPVNGATVQIQVTKFGPISVGDEIVVDNRTFTVTAKTAPDILTIRNDGNGGTPGDIVYADSNNDGQKDQIIEVVNSPDPCSIGAASTADAILACNGGQRQPVQGQFDGDVLAWDAASSLYRHRSFPETEFCTALIDCLVLDPANPPTTTYLIDVVDIGPFQDILANPPGAISDICITIDGDPFSLIEEVAGSLRVRPGFIVAGPTKYEENSPVCIPDCCGQCENDMDLSDAVTGNIPGTSYGGIVVGIPYNDATNVTLFDIDGAFAVAPVGTNLDSIELCNPSKCHQYITALWNYEIQLTNLPSGARHDTQFLLSALATGTDISGNPSTFTYAAQEKSNGLFTGPSVPVAAPAAGSDYLFGGPANSKIEQYYADSLKVKILLPPFECVNLNLRIKNVLIVDPGAGAGAYNLEFGSNLIIERKSV